MSLSERTAVPQQRAVPIARSAVAATADGSPARPLPAPATAVCTASVSQPAYFAVATAFGVASIAALVLALLH